jgi:N-acyl-D-aspartate/D-glutamate deacylase
VKATGEVGGIFEITNEDAAFSDPEAQAEYFERMSKLALDSRATFMFGVGSTRHAPDGWRAWTGLIDRVAEAGGRMYGQVHSRRFDVILSFAGQLPFDRLPLWQALRSKPVAEQKQALRDPDLVAKLVHEAHHGPYGNAIGAEARRPDFDWIFLMDEPMGPHRCLGALAREQGRDPVALMIELALASDFDQLFLQSIANENPENVLALMKHPRTLTTFSDAGAHVSQISDCSIATHLLGHWVRREQKVGLEEAVHWLTGRPAAAFGFGDRGVLRAGAVADLVVFDPARIAPEMPKIEYDLPEGARRLVQKATGISATIVGGEVLLRDGVHTGALPGRLLRRGVAMH